MNITFQNCTSYDDLREAMLKQAKIDDKIVMARRTADAPHARHIKKLPQGVPAPYVENMKKAVRRRKEYIPFLRENPGSTRVDFAEHFKVSSSSINSDIAYLWRNGLIRIERPGRGVSHYYAVQDRMAAE